MDPESVIVGPDAGTKKFVAGSPVPVHVRIVQRRFGCQGIFVIQSERHADGEPQALVLPGDGNSKNMVKRVGGPVLTGPRSIFEIDIGHGIVLPDLFRCESDVMTLPVGSNQLDVAHVKTHIGKRRIGTAAIDRLTLPGGNERNVNGLVPLAAGGAESGRGERGKRSCRQGQVATLLTSAGSSSLAGAPPSSLSGAIE